ncbi:thiosulfate sulfurtransferase/rhodanese-like domain-containing protein 3 [Paramormyrops kingsleyae]|uniref:Sulfurtransferase n=1 Tax=Paramormyrops kingsleyae TaxID=1676925 RepID=A0A3B3QIU3_9TELE|nr:thiosulfate sulfurtransferase/rhodanese-like domain-containing protein 3 [Paramormyrops kingsleyae]
MSLKECLKLTGLIHRVLLNGSLTPPTCSRTLSCLSKARTHYAFCPRTPAALHVLRGCSSAPQADFTVSHQQLKQLLSTRTGVVIDVREPWELREYGSIPGSINVPLGQVNQALQLTPDDFREKYGSDMPRPNNQVVFSCLAGIRSKKALDTAVSLGYSNVQHYPGGWEEWAEREVLRTKH